MNLFKRVRFPQLPLPIERMVATLMFCMLYAVAIGQGSWELKVCADPANEPASNSDLGGFENRIAAIVADELGATLTFDWTIINDATVRDHLERGACDVVMSVGEGASGLLNTVSYYRMPLVFLSLRDSGISIESLYDNALAGLRIGAMPNTSSHMVLLDLGLGSNYVGIQPDVSKRGAGRIRPTVEALRSGRIDIAIVAGGPASVYVNAEPDVFTITPVQPELVPPLTPMFDLMTMGVRPRDEALRDALNRAIAKRWDEIQAVFEDLDVPLLPSQPVVAGERPSGLVSVGVVAPFPSGFPTELDDVAESTYFGTSLADELSTRGEDRQKLQLHISYASAPSTDSALRAFDRLVAVDHVKAIVVAHNAQVTLALAGQAAETGVPLINALSGADELRSSACYPTTLHVAPSDTMYAGAMVRQAVQEGAGSVVIVHDSTEWSRETSANASEVLSGLGVESTLVEVSDGPVFPYSDVIAVTGAGVDAALLFLPPVSQSLFMFELDRERFGALTIGFPWPLMQTRAYYFQLKQDSPSLLNTPRISAWDATVVDNGANELNVRFSSRSARAMDSSAWAAYAAVELVAAASVSDSVVTDATAAIRDSVMKAHLFKGQDLTFDFETNQLLQPLFLVQVDPDASWSAAVSQRIEIASVVGMLPADPSVLDSGPDRVCR